MAGTFFEVFLFSFGLYLSFGVIRYFFGLEKKRFGRCFIRKKNYNNICSPDGGLY